MMTMNRRISISEDLIRPQLLTLREFRPFKTSDEYLWAMKEDLSDWLNLLYPDLRIIPQTFMESLETGITLCKHANNVRSACKDWMTLGKKLPKCWGREWKLPAGEVIFNANARPETFFARDNVHNFITWCRKLGIFECLLFESDDLILRKNEKSVILCLLEVARRGSHFGMAAPLLVQFEKEIDRDIAKDTGQDLSSSGEEEESFQEYGPVPQIITNDLRSLDDMVRELVERCSCPTQFPMIRVAEGKYRIGNTKVMIYVRILRNHVMVRVGGGWDTLAHYLDKHDPCHCSTGHRAAVSSRLILMNDSTAPRMKVEYERRDLSFEEPLVHSTPKFISTIKKGTSPGTGPDLSDSSSEISDEGYKTSDNLKLLLGGTPEDTPISKGHQNRKASILRARSLSTDEERPDSRSTDEETLQSPPQRERPIMKSCSTGRVPRCYGVSAINHRSISCERTPTSDMAFHRSRQEEGGGARSIRTGPTNSSTSQLHYQPGRIPKYPLPSWSQPRRSNSALATSRTNLPGRSLSASGTAEFYGRTLPTPHRGPTKPLSRLGGINKSSTNGSISSKSNPKLSAGKNTWNGSNTNTGSLNSRSSPRVRPNLFQPNLFSKVETTRAESNESEISDSSVEERSNLAEWIKKALELESDADKISHIELAIKQFEEQSRQGSPDGTSSGTFGDGSIPFSGSPSQSLLSMRKRKDNGSTKIPKPSFY